MGKRGPKVIPIDKKQFEQLCSIQCILTEISGWFGVSDDKIEYWCKETYGKKFSEVFKEKRSKGHVSLRRSQYKAALAGNTTMQIWLGKQYLKQTDKVEEVHLFKDYDKLTDAELDEEIRKLEEKKNA